MHTRWTIFDGYVNLLSIEDKKEEGVVSLIDMQGGIGMRDLLIGG